MKKTQKVQTEKSNLKANARFMKLKQILQAIFSGKKCQAHAKNDGTNEVSKQAAAFIEKHRDSIGQNPYLQSRALWLDLYGDSESRYKNSRKLNFVLIGIIVLCIFGMVHVGDQSKFIPYVVEMKDGQIINERAVESSNFEPMKAAMAIYFMRAFIESSRSVSVDGYIERHHQQKAYALTEKAATTELSEFYQAFHPYEVVKKRTISVHIDYVNRLPGDAFQVGWTEISRDSRTGVEISQKNYEGEFGFHWGKPSQHAFILQNNPFGFYITNISWTGVNA